MLTFDEPSHVYRWNGAPVPSVTQVLKPLSDFSMIAPGVLDYARDRGIAAHKLIELDLAGDLDESSVCGQMLGYLERWREFLAVTQFKAKHSELRLYSKKYGYAGTLDLYGSLSDNEPSALIDVKTGAVMPAARPQLAAYAQLLTENGYCYLCTRRVLHLTPDKWTLLPRYKDHEDIRVFLSCLTIHNFMKGN